MHLVSVCWMLVNKHTYHPTALSKWSFEMAWWFFKKGTCMPLANASTSPWKWVLGQMLASGMFLLTSKSWLWGTFQLYIRNLCSQSLRVALCTGQPLPKPRILGSTSPESTSKMGERESWMWSSVPWLYRNPEMDSAYSSFNIHWYIIKGKMVNALLSRWRCAQWRCWACWEVNAVSNK